MSTPSPTLNPYIKFQESVTQCLLSLGICQSLLILQGPNDHTTLNSVIFFYINNG